MRDLPLANFLYLSFSTLRSSSLWRTDTIFFTKLNKPPLTPGLYYFSPPPSPEGLIEDLPYPDITFLNIFEIPLVTDMFVGIVKVSKPYFVSLPTLMATCLGITSPRWRRKRQFVGPVWGQTWVPGSITEYLIYRKEWQKGCRHTCKNTMFPLSKISNWHEKFSRSFKFLLEFEAVRNSTWHQ